MFFFFTQWWDIGGNQDGLLSIVDCSPDTWDFCLKISQFCSVVTSLPLGIMTSPKELHAD